MSLLKRLNKYAFPITFTTLFVGMHYGWHLLQLKKEVNHGGPPHELPATIFVKYLIRKMNESQETALTESTSPVSATAANKQ